MAVDKDSASKPPSAIDEITHLASMLMSFGDTDIYNKTYEELVRSVRSSGKVSNEGIPPSADVRYEYVWDVPRIIAARARHVIHQPSHIRPSLPRTTREIGSSAVVRFSESPKKN